ncbi:HlyD family efflux transporter periplasmic adaptor subunit [Kosakonia quasisacchari]|uniref:HlyD family efflux transporter periplasmic adaptor subunit n=1 Tax=Kosakonia quasisacchari TaxID=2529380 RepID=A0A4R0GIR3_9ENTR|nr:HlyD family efflux transporter periplasmic adaptor subunit [Kosakonia quasisacchari]TCB96657.1 HlyD family efflux transporter periplasmic adaptor subunit [Kosakonia quasisacchari]
MTLFRREAVEHQNDTALGEIIIPTSSGTSLSALLTLCLLVLIFIFLCCSQYTRKAHLSGIIMPSSGLIKVIPQYSGYVTALKTAEGQRVTIGSPLYYISGEHYDGQGAGTLAALRLSLNTQYQMLESQQRLETRDNSQQQQGLQQRLSSLQPQLQSAQQRLTQAEQQAQLSVSVMNRYRDLVPRHYVSDIEYQQRQMAVSAANENVEEQRLVLLQLRTAKEAAEDELQHLITLGESRKQELDRQLQGIRQQQVELASQENFMLTAPVSGTVAAILVKEGQPVRATEPVMTLVPDNARLQVELYATSQNAGFIQPGQRVALRFSAFPYQKFGVQYGTIREISRTTLTPSDLLSVSPVTWKENEGHYRVIVEPEQTFIKAYGRQEPLRPGMTLEGDVSLDTRYLWEWLTEPLWTVKGKL